MLWRAISLILCLQTLLMPFADVWQRLLRYSSLRKRISPFSVFSTAASETTFKPIPRSVSPPGWKALLNADTRTDGVALRLTANVHQAFERFAVSKEIINQQHTLSLFQTTLADVDGTGRLVGEGEHISGIHIVAKVAALSLFGDDDGQVAHRQRSGHGKDDAAGFDGEDAVNLVIAESVRERLPNMACEGGINAVVEEALDADNAAGEDVTVLKNALLKFLHGVIPAFFADFFVGCNCCVSAPG